MRASMKHSLKNKILIGIPAVFITVMIIVIVAITGIHSNHSRKEADTLLQNSFNTIRYTMSERKSDLIDDFEQAALLNNMGNMIKYIADNSPFFKYSIMKPTYMKLADLIHSTNTIADIDQSFIYDLKGNLISFSFTDANQCITGYIHDNENIEAVSGEANAEISYQSWERIDKLPDGIKYEFGREIPIEKITEYQIIDNTLCLVAYIPIKGKDYNPLTEKMEARQIGLGMLVKKFGAKFTEKMTELSGVKIDIYLQGESESAENRLFDFNQFKSVSNHRAINNQDLIFKDVELAQEDYYGAFLPIHSGSKCIAAIAAFHSKDSFHANTNQIIMFLSIIYILGIVIIVPATIYLVFKGIINPVKNVAASMRQIADKKDFTKMIEIECDNEIGELAASFNEMIANLRTTTTSIDNLNHEIAERKQAEEIVQQQNDFFAIVIDSLTHPFYVIDAETRSIKLHNSAAYKGNLPAGMKCYQMTHKSDVPCHKAGEICPFEEVKKTKKAVMTEHIHYDINGNPQHVEVHSYPVIDKNGNVREVIEYCIDISKRKKAEVDLKKLNSELESKNEEMKNFIYIASHDLREPLRKITAFGKLLQDSLKDKLAGEDSENLSFMIDGATRLTKMIEGLLVYSRVSTQAQPRQTTDLNEIIEQIRNIELSVVLHEKQVIIDIPEPLPSIEVDPVQIRQLMQNLIANGIKYQKKDNQPKITITRKPAANGMVKIEITDNGIGIAPEYQSAIFAMFKRLHARSEYEGTGIGLSVCKKIVERHGGQIGVESQAGKGSTFWFTVPTAKELIIAEIS